MFGIDGRSGNLTIWDEIDDVMDAVIFEGI